MQHTSSCPRNSGSATFLHYAIKDVFWWSPFSLIGPSPPIWCQHRGESPAWFSMVLFLKTRMLMVLFSKTAALCTDQYISRRLPVRSPWLRHFASASEWIKPTRIVLWSSYPTSIKNKISKIGKICSSNQKSQIIDEKGNKITIKNKGYLHKF